MTLGQKNTSLFFLGVALVILPAFVYGIPINIVEDVQTPSGELDEIVSEALAQVSIVTPLPEKLEVTIPKESISSIPVEVIPQIGEVSSYLVDVKSIPSKLEVAFTEKPLNQISLEKKLPIVPVEPQVDELGLPEILETIVSEQQLPLLSVETISPVDNKNLLLEKSEKVQETLKPLVVASILHIENVQVVIPEKLVEKIFSKNPNSSVRVDTDNINVAPEKVEEAITEALHPLVVIASIPQIGNIQLVFSEELVKSILSRKSPLVHIESQPEIDDITGTTTTLEDIVQEKPCLLIPVKPIQEVGKVLPEKTEVAVPGELLDQKLAINALVSVKEKHQNTDVTIKPASLEETVTEKSVLLDPVELTPQVKEEILKINNPLNVVASIPLVDGDKTVESKNLLDAPSSKKLLSVIPVELNSQISGFLPNVVVPIPALLESLGEIVTKKPHLLVPVESRPKLDELVPEIHEPLAVVASIPQVGNVEVLHTTVPPKKPLSLIPAETNSQLADVLLPEVVDEKSLPVIPISHGDDVVTVIPVALPSTVVNEISNGVLAVSTTLPKTL